MKRRASALLGALFLTVWAALPVLAAAPPGKVSIEATGCTFSVQINLDHAYDLIGWKVKQYDAVNWNNGLTLFKGSGPTDGSGDLTVGPFTAPEGHYNAIVDNEYPPDGSSIVVDFWLSCPVASAPASSSPTPASSESPASSEAPSDSPPVDGSIAPSTEPSGSELPAQGSGQPSGQVEGATGTPGGHVTPPPTDTTSGTPTPGDSGLPIVLGTILVASALVLAPSRRVRSTVIARRSR